MGVRALAVLARHSARPRPRRRWSSAQAAQVQPTGQAQPRPLRTRPFRSRTRPSRGRREEGTKPAEEQAPRTKSRSSSRPPRSSSSLSNAPATVSVIGQQTLDSKASQDYAGLFARSPAST